MCQEIFLSGWSTLLSVRLFFTIRRLPAAVGKQIVSRGAVFFVMAIEYT